jgi:PPOX class probable F420-dependent enzyme
MIIEVRKYRVKPGQRDAFIRFFEERAVPLQRELGMLIVGPLLDLEDPDVFVWLRGFASLAEQDRLKSALYDGDPWKSELESIAMPMLDTYEAVLTETSEGVVFDTPQADDGRLPRSASPVPAEFLDLLEPGRRAFAHLATILPDGSPQLTPVWFDYDGVHLIVNTVHDRVKRRTMPPGARVAVEISDPDNPYRYIQVRGTVAQVTEADGDAVIDRLACKYLGVERFPGRLPDERRVTVRISIDRTQTMDYVPSD